MDMKEFIDQLPFVLGELYANGVKGKQPKGFVFSMFECFDEANAQGAFFFGPVAVIPQNDEHTRWLIKDLRGGWGYNPLDLYFTTDPEVDPTLDRVCKELTIYRGRLQHKADSVEELTRKLCK